MQYARVEVALVTTIEPRVKQQWFEVGRELTTPILWTMGVDNIEKWPEATINNYSNVSDLRCIMIVF